jgi:predicted transcriptional regulator
MFLSVSMVVTMVTPRQIRAARALLGWSQQQLADKAIVSLNAVTRLEKGKVDSRVSTIAAIEKTLSETGVEFLPAGERGEGVRMKSPKA